MKMNSNSGFLFVDGLWLLNVIVLYWSMLIAWLHQPYCLRGVVNLLKHFQWHDIRVCLSNFRPLVSRRTRVVIFSKYSSFLFVSAKIKTEKNRIENTSKFQNIFLAEDSRYLWLFFYIIYYVITGPETAWTIRSLKNSINKTRQRCLHLH